MNSTTSSEELSTPPGGEEPEASLSDVKKLMDMQVTDSNGKKSSYWSTAMETFGMAGGKDVGGDLWLESVEQGVPMLKQYIKQKDLKLAEQNAQASSSSSSSNKGKDNKKNNKKLPFSSWMDLVPLDEFHTTQSNFLKAFLKWSIKDREDVIEGSDEAKLIVNASKARRRLDCYFDWMKDNMAEDILKNPLTMESVMAAAKIWDLQSTHTEDGRLAWWFNMGKMDKEAIKSMPVQEHMRYGVWFCHLVMFDTKAQDNGVVLLEDLDKMGFWSMATLMPMDLSAKMDRLTIGVLPVKMKGIYMFGAARWLNLMLGLMKPFLGKKMRERMIVVTETMAPDRQQFCDDLVGRANIPEGFMDLQGEIPPDAMLEKLKKKGKKKQKKAKKKEKETLKNEAINV